MTKRQIAQARRDAFRDAPYRVYYNSDLSIRAFAEEPAARTFAAQVEGRLVAASKR